MKSIKRREFIGTLALATAGAGSVVRGAAQVPKLKMGVIGCGWYGMVDLKAALKTGEVEAVALCDVDSEHLSKSAGEVEKIQGSRPKTFKDYRELLDMPGLQAIILATPPHWHALPFIAACEKGLDIYCEKPLAYDISEGRAMVEAARRSGKVIQVGFQRRQSEALRQAGQYVREGKAGKLVQVDVQIHYPAVMADSTPQNPPASLDWETWCGPAPKLQYNPNIGHMNWRLEAAYGNGHLVDWGIHLIDIIRLTLGEETPRSVQASGGIYYLKGKITTPDVLTAHFEFERCPVVWRHRLWGAAEYNPEVSNGIFYYGDRETVFATDSRWVVIPREKGAEKKVTEVQSDPGSKHMMDFLEAVKTRRKPSCTVEDAFFSTATVQLAMISWKTGSRVNWDPATRQILDNPQAARLLKREYRAPYRHPYSG